MNGWMIILFYLLLVTVFFVAFFRLMSHSESSGAGIHKPVPNEDVIVVKAADNLDEPGKERDEGRNGKTGKKKDDDEDASRTALIDDAPIIEGYLDRAWWNKLEGIKHLGTNEQADIKATLRSFGYISEKDIPILIKKKELEGSTDEGGADTGKPDEGPGINPEFSDEEKAQNDFAGQYGRHQRSDEEFDPDEEMEGQM